MDAWVAEKIGAAPPSRVVFDLIAPPRELIDGNIVDSLARELPRAAVELPKLGGIGRVSIVANGPSARTYRMGCGDTTVALNGALELFRKAGVAPTFWCACDPHPFVASLLDWVPDETVYLVASKCHPDVFDRLRGKTVWIFHAVDANERWGLFGNDMVVAGGVSITSRAINLIAAFAGAKRFDVWGWDCAFGLDGAAHGSAQPQAGDRITVEAGARAFVTTPSWAMEAQDSVAQISVSSYRIRVKGPGLLAHLLRIAGIRNAMSWREWMFQSTGLSA